MTAKRSKTVAQAVGRMYALMAKAAAKKAIELAGQPAWLSEAGEMAEFAEACLDDAGAQATKDYFYL